MEARVLLPVMCFFISFSGIISSQPAENGNYLQHGNYNSINIQKNPWSFNNRQITLETGRFSANYYIGPEIAVEGASGFYDHQTYGDCRRYINRLNGTILHAVYMTSPDSMNVNDSRRTVYSYSDDEGNTWTFITNVPDEMSGYPSLSVLDNGAAVVSNQFDFAGITRGFLSYDIDPGAGSFAPVEMPFNISRPVLSKFSGGLILAAGSSFSGQVSTDTGIVMVFDPATYNFSNSARFKTAGVDQSGMIFTNAAGTGGRALYLMNTVNDTGGPGGFNRMFITFTENAGLTWQPVSLFYEPQQLQGELAIPFGGLDAIYDATGNYYVAFNTLNENSEFSSARLWVSKNGGTPVLVAQHSGINGIPEAAATMVSPQTGMCTIDHPSLSISANGSVIYVVYSVMYQDDIVNDFNACHIYISISSTSSQQFSEPIKITNSGPGSFDERYPSIERNTPDLGGMENNTVYLVYQKDPQPGSSSYSDGAPLSRASLTFRKIFDLGPVFGINGNFGNTAKEYKLYQNYPNPFNPVSTIEYSMPHAGNVELVVFDMLGRVVETVYTGYRQAGNYLAVFNGAHLASGVYYYRITSGNFTETKKMMLIK